MQEVPSLLAPARLADVARSPQLLPVVPEWAYPDPGERRAEQLRQAAQGPYDGTRGVVVVTRSGPPLVVAFVQGEVVYRHDPRSSSAGQVVYRYDPEASHLHPQLMAAVTGAYAETGPSYAAAAATDDPRWAELAPLAGRTPQP